MDSLDEGVTAERVYTEAKKCKLPCVFIQYTVVNRDGTEKKRKRTMVFMNEADAHDYYDYKNDQLNEELPRIDECINDLVRRDYI